MSLEPPEILHVLVVVLVLLGVAHLGGSLARKIGIPTMVGELAGGVLLGATALQRIWPAAHAWLIPMEGTSPVRPILGFCSTIGLLILLFIGGLELRQLFTRKDAYTVGWVSASGIVIPVTAGLLLLEVIDVSGYLGHANSMTALKIILLIELAITSIPVITRIFMDLGLMSTRLASLVLSVAVIEDVLLYIALSMALSMAQAGPKGNASILHLLGLAPGSLAFMAWHVTANLALLVAAAWSARKTRQASSRINVLARHSPMGWMLASLLIITVVTILLGLAPMFGALIAGIVTSRNTQPAQVKARQQIEAVGRSIFIPLYFALIGVSLDFIRDFDWRFSAGLLLIGCIVKYGGSLAGALAAGEAPAMANALAISVNARGGPGLVVASTAFSAGIVNASAYTSLVTLAVATSVLAGVILARLLRSHASIAG